MDRRKTPPLITAMVAGLLTVGLVNLAQSANMSAIQAKTYALELKRKTDEAKLIEELATEVATLKSQKKAWEDAKARLEAKMVAMDAFCDKVIEIARGKRK